MKNKDLINWQPHYMAHEQDKALKSTLRASGDPFKPSEAMLLLNALSVGCHRLSMWVVSGLIKLLSKVQERQKQV